MPRAISASSRRALTVALVAALGSVTVGAGPAAADDDRPTVSAGPTGPSTLGVTGQVGNGSSNGGSPGLGGGATAAEIAAAQEAYVLQMAQCAAAVASVNSNPAGVLGIMTYCDFGGDDATQPVAPVITTEMVTQVAMAAAPPVQPHVQPGARSYVHVPNNFWAETVPTQTSVTVVGVTIPLTWTPVTTTWQFGDGTTATGTGKRDAEVGDPAAVEHGYERSGSYDITTTTSYDVSFVIPGAGAQTVRLTSPPSAPVTLPVGEIQTRVDATN